MFRKNNHPASENAALVDALDLVIRFATSPFSPIIECNPLRPRRVKNVGCIVQWRN